MTTKFLSTLFLLCALNMTAQNWQADYNKAQELASQNDQKLILVFSGSDWCTPCIKLENDIWKSEEFQHYAADHYVLYKADFPRKKANKLPKELAAQNAALAEKYNPNGYFPLVVVINSNGQVIGNTAYKDINPQAYINLINSF